MDLHVSTATIGLAAIGVLGLILALVLPLLRTFLLAGRRAEPVGFSARRFQLTFMSLSVLAASVARFVRPDSPELMVNVLLGGMGVGVVLLFLIPGLLDD